MPGGEGPEHAQAPRFKSRKGWVFIELSIFPIYWKFIFRKTIAKRAVYCGAMITIDRSGRSLRGFALPSRRDGHRKKFAKKLRNMKKRC
jgi:hypothetical protein